MRVGGVHTGGESGLIRVSVNGAYHSMAYGKLRSLLVEHAGLLQPKAYNIVGGLHRSNCSMYTKSFNVLQRHR